MEDKFYNIFKKLNIKSKNIGLLLNQIKKQLEYTDLDEKLYDNLSSIIKNMDDIDHCYAGLCNNSRFAISLPYECIYEYNDYYSEDDSEDRMSLHYSTLHRSAEDDYEDYYFDYFNYKFYYYGDEYYDCDGNSYTKCLIRNPDSYYTIKIWDIYSKNYFSIKSVIDFRIYDILTSYSNTVLNFCLSNKNKYLAIKYYHNCDSYGKKKIQLSYKPPHNIQIMIVDLEIDKIIYEYDSHENDSYEKFDEKKKYPRIYSERFNFSSNNMLLKLEYKCICNNYLYSDIDHCKNPSDLDKPSELWSEIVIINIVSNTMKKISSFKDRKVKVIEYNKKDIIFEKYYSYFNTIYINNATGINLSYDFTDNNKYIVESNSNENVKNIKKALHESIKHLPNSILDLIIVFEGSLIEI